MPASELARFFGTGLLGSFWAGLFEPPRREPVDAASVATLRGAAQRGHLALMVCLADEPDGSGLRASRPTSKAATEPLRGVKGSQRVRSLVVAATGVWDSVLRRAQLVDDAFQRRDHLRAIDF